MRFPEAKIIVFAKAPVVGYCKTRLIPALGEQGATELHRKLIHHTLNTATRSGLCPVELWCADDTAHPFIIECGRHYPVAIRQQQGKNLGERMYNAFRETLSTAPFAVLIGTDCPTLSKQDLQEALQALRDKNLCTLNPAEDGGYVSIGLSQPEQKLFTAIQWGEATVYQETLQRLEQLKWPWKALATHRDIDRPEDLLHLNIDGPGV